MKGCDVMKSKTLQTVMVSSLLMGLMTPVLPSYALTTKLPQKIVSVKYPSDYQQKIDEIAVCILEAESEIYDQKTLQSLPKLPTSESRSCRDILKSKPYAKNITFQVNYSKSHADPGVKDGELIIINKAPQSTLTILSKPLNLTNIPYTKPTETLEIAMRMFQDLNIGFHGDLSALHQENDILDVLYLRLFNLVYELPKAQGHPIMTEFMKDIRDNFFRVSSSRFFRALIWFASDYNPDKELSRTLSLYLHQLEYAGTDPGSQIPDENLKLPGEEDIVDQTPPLTDFIDTSRDDYEQIWDNAYKDAVAKEDQEDLGQIHTIQTPLVSREVLKTYAVKSGVCMEVTTTYENNRVVDKKMKEASKDNIYRCGDSSLLAGINTSSDTADDSLLNPILSYRYGEDGEWVHTSIKAKEGALSYSALSGLLSTISTELGSGYLQDHQRFLYILSNKPLYLEKYKNNRTIQELNEWLNEEGVELEFGLNIESKDKQHTFFDWLAQSDR